jgi:hypothetical protein
MLEEVLIIEFADVERLLTDASGAKSLKHDVAGNLERDVGDIKDRCGHCDAQSVSG